MAVGYYGMDPQAMAAMMQAYNYSPFNPNNYSPYEQAAGGLLAGTLGSYLGGIGSVLGGGLLTDQLMGQYGQNMMAANQQQANYDLANRNLDNQKQQIANQLQLGNTALSNQLAMQKNSLGALGNVFGGMFGKNGLSGLFGGLGNTLGGLFGGAGAAGGEGGGENSFSGFGVPLMTGFSSPSGQSASLDLGGNAPHQGAHSFSNSVAVNPSGSPFTGGAGAPSAAMAQRQNRAAVPPSQRPLYDSLLAGGGQPAFA